MLPSTEVSKRIIDYQVVYLTMVQTSKPQLPPICQWSEVIIGVKIVPNLSLKIF